MLKAKAQRLIEEHPYLDDLYKFLSKGGMEVVLNYDDFEEIDKIINRGLTWYKEDKMMVGESSACHSNSANLFENNSDICRIATGYALSKDGIWREHSWIVVSKSGEFLYEDPTDWILIETTVKRVEYFGYILTEEESFRFAFENY